MELPRGRGSRRGFRRLDLRTDDKQVHLLRKSGTHYREVTSDKDWPTYNGDPRGNRFTELNQITKANVQHLSAKWVFALPNAGRLQLTPVVVGGLMYVTAPNECYALDAGTGRPIWHYQGVRTREMTTDPGVNRGAGVAGDRLFMETGNAHVLALNRFTGELLWDSPIADWHLNYFATSAPLPAGDLVITGVEVESTARMVSSQRSTRAQEKRFGALQPYPQKASPDRYLARS